MAALIKLVRISKKINSVTNLLTNLSLSSNGLPNSSTLCKISRIAVSSTSFFHSSSKRSDLMEFFDEKKNWGENEVKTGRSWKTDELRLKSNEDLHKLWYVLLKERNMLLTMEEACKEDWQVFPSPERLDKVEDSMNHLECVVRERNKAYHMLETGESGEQPTKMVSGQLGLKFRYKLRQHSIPKHMNKNWQKKHKFGFGGNAVRKFLRLYNEKKWDAKRRALNREKNHVQVLIRKFPNLDMEAVKAKFPKVDIEEIKRRRRAVGHYIPK